MSIEEIKKKKKIAVSLANMICEHYSLNLDTKSAHIKTKKGKLFHDTNKLLRKINKPSKSYYFHFNNKEFYISSLMIEDLSEFILEGKFSNKISINQLKILKSLFVEFDPNK